MDKMARFALANEVLRAVGHDLKSPLTAIIGSLEAMKTLGPRLTEQQREMLSATALKEAFRLQHFIQNIMTLSRLDQGALELQRVEMPFSEIIRPLRDKMKQQHSHVILTVEESAISLPLDPKWFGEALWQILDNIGKHNANTVMADIRIKEKQITISDQGAGIPSSIAPIIFDRHVKGPVTEHQDASAGVGLTIAQKIVQAHEGDIALVSVETGACFLITL